MNKWLNKKIFITMDLMVMIMVFCTQIALNTYRFALINGVLTLVFVILFVRMWVRIGLSKWVDRQNKTLLRDPSFRNLAEKVTRQTLPGDMCKASKQSGAGFIFCTFPRGHQPASSHSWTVDI